MVKGYIEIDSAITELELMRERAGIICADLIQDYFTHPETSEYEFDNARIKNDIIFDYLFQIKEKLKELRGLVE